VKDDTLPLNASQPHTQIKEQPPANDGLLPLDEEAKLVYGVVFSLRNMVRKLGGK